jgi:glycosyltransferase involved in cell wall biosynthesis
MRAVRGRDPGPEWDEYRRRVRIGLAAAATVVAPTAAVLRAILEAYGIDPPTRVIPNACAAAAWRPAEKASIVLSAGRLWDEAKGLADLDTCARQVAWPIVVAGPNAPPGAPEPLRSRAVHALGPLSPHALSGWMARASIYALPARYEPFGLSVLEAALSGCTLVLGDLATLREVWGDTAVYVPPGDPDALGFALNALIFDPLSRGAHAARSRARALAMTPDRMAAAYHALYDELIAAPALRREALA